MASNLARDCRFIEIGSNLTDPVFRGRYHGSKKHEDDFDQMLGRARAAGVKAQIVTGGSLKESTSALALVKKHDDLYCTVGCHPTRSSEFEKDPRGADAYYDGLARVIEENMGGHKGKGKVVAVGECGLDYDRLFFSPADTQKTYFSKQLSLAARFGLPLFLHSRAAHDDFLSILRPHIPALQAACGGMEGDKEGRWKGVGRIGVAHSFTGTVEEMKELVEAGLFIGVNGCSLKTEDQLKMVKEIPLERLMLETDAPWCETRQTHASHSHLAALSHRDPSLYALFFPGTCKPERWAAGKTVKGRNEPCAIGGVAWIVAQVKGVSFETVVEEAWRNTQWVFGIGAAMADRTQEAPKMDDEQFPSLSGGGGGGGVGGRRTEQANAASETGKPDGWSVW